MKWTAVWLPDAQNDLATLWTLGPDRSEVAAAADEIDRLIAADPLNQGESRDEGERLLVVHPLAVRYTVSPDDCLVTVRAVWRVG
jgi:hypothetical protein